MTVPDNDSVRKAGAALRELFATSGYVRLPDPAKKKERERAGSRYRKGYEVRLVVDTMGEVELARELIRLVGFKPGRSFAKHRRLVQPVYGRAATEWFLEGQAARPSRPSPSRTRAPRRAGISASHAQLGELLARLSSTSPRRP